MAEETDLPVVLAMPARSFRLAQVAMLAQELRVLHVIEVALVIVTPLSVTVICRPLTVIARAFQSPGFWWPRFAANTWYTEPCTARAAASVNLGRIVEHLNLHPDVCGVTLSGARIPIPLFAPSVSYASNWSTKSPYSFSV